MLEIQSFKDLPLSMEVLKSIKELGFETLFPIQAQAIMPLLEGKDVIGQAQTGTGKTAAFGVPMVERLDPQVRKVQGLILVPTRELAMQVAQNMHQFAKYRKLRVLPVYGGASIERQIRELQNGAQIVVGTPGRVIDLMERRVLNLSYVKVVVLDEADRMLDMGFIEDIELHSFQSTIQQTNKPIQRNHRQNRDERLQQIHEKPSENPRKQRRNRLNPDETVLHRCKPRRQIRHPLHNSTRKQRGTSHSILPNTPRNKQNRRPTMQKRLPHPSTPRRLHATTKRTRNKRFQSRQTKPARRHRRCSTRLRHRRHNSHHQLRRPSRPTSVLPPSRQNRTQRRRRHRHYPGKLRRNEQLQQHQTSRKQR